MEFRDCPAGPTKDNNPEQKQRHNSFGYAVPSSRELAYGLRAQYSIFANSYSIPQYQTLLKGAKCHITLYKMDRGRVDRRFVCSSLFSPLHSLVHFPSCLFISLHRSSLLRCLRLSLGGIGYGRGGLVRGGRKGGPRQLERRQQHPGYQTSHLRVPLEPVHKEMISRTRCLETYRTRCCPHR